MFLRVSHDLNYALSSVYIMALLKSGPYDTSAPLTLYWKDEVSNKVSKLINEARKYKPEVGELFIDQYLGLSGTYDPLTVDGYSLNLEGIVKLAILAEYLSFTSGSPIPYHAIAVNLVISWHFNGHSKNFERYLPDVPYYAIRLRREAERLFRVA